MAKHCVPEHLPTSYFGLFWTPSKYIHSNNIDSTPKVSRSWWVMDGEAAELVSLRPMVFSSATTQHWCGAAAAGGSAECCQSLYIVVLQYVCVLVFEAIFEVAFNAVVLYTASSLLSCVSVRQRRPPLLCRREGRRRSSDGRALLMGKKARDGAKISPKPSLLGRELEYIYNILVHTTFHGKSAEKEQMYCIVQQAYIRNTFKVHTLHYCL